LQTAVVFVSGTRERSEIYKLHLQNGEIKQLKKLDECVSTPEIPPDDKRILFAHRAGQGNTPVWIMNGHGNHPRLVNDTIDTRGHSSWSVSGLITLDMGGPLTTRCI
jgi:Tol biopolymer transport system component